MKSRSRDRSQSIDTAPAIGPNLPASLPLRNRQKSQLPSKILIARPAENVTLWRFALKAHSWLEFENSGRVSDEADDIPPYSNSSSMNRMNVGHDLAQLSYKELQALAVRYRVPGNIKVSCHRSRSRQ